VIGDIDIIFERVAPSERFVGWKQIPPSSNALYRRIAPGSRLRITKTAPLVPSQCHEKISRGEPAENSEARIWVSTPDLPYLLSRWLQLLEICRAPSELAGCHGDEPSRDKSVEVCSEYAAALFPSGVVPRAKRECDDLRGRHDSADALTWEGRLKLTQASLSNPVGNFIRY
jgi:hypothetical protein